MSARRALAARVLGAPEAGRVGSTRPRDAPSRVGRFTLRPQQVATVDELRAALDEFGGALLADPPGAGKTVVALAVAATHPRTLVLGPAALRAQWAEAAARAGVEARYLSLEALSRGHHIPDAPFVIVDEAHHVRTPGTRRYARLAAYCAPRRLLLLTATPVVNRRADRDALLALFLGARAATRDPAAIARCVVRSRHAGDGRPRLRRLGPIAPAPQPDRELEAAIATALRTLPPPLPLADGASAAALIAMSLAMAWQSSLAALDAALRRREQRGEAMRDLLASGLAPSHALLRHWTLGDDATQLALPLLVAMGAPSGAPAPDHAPQDARRTLEAHLAAVRALRALIRPHRAADAVHRARALRALLADHPGRRIVVFARHLATVRALATALRGVGGVVSIEGTRVRAAAGRWTRDEVLRSLGSRAGPAVGAPSRVGREIRLLLSTDVLAEGVELQGIGIVVHADIPWTPARLEQRVGRIRRPGAADPECLETWFCAPDEARALVRLGARLARKARARSRALRDAEARAEIRARLSRWLTGPGPRRANDPGAARVRPALPADGGAGAGDLTARLPDFLAATPADPRGEAWTLVGGIARPTGGWRLVRRPRRVLPLVRRADDLDRAGRDAAPVEPAPRDRPARAPRIARLLVERIERLLARRAARRFALALAAPGSGEDPRLARVRRRLARLLERAPALARPVIAARQDAWLARLARPLPVACERRIDALLAEPDDAAFARGLGAALAEGPRAGGGPAANMRAEAGAAGRAAPAPVVLLLSPCAPRTAAGSRAPTSASPGTAALR